MWPRLKFSGDRAQVIRAVMDEFIEGHLAQIELDTVGVDSPALAEMIPEDATAQVQDLIERRPLSPLLRSLRRVLFLVIAKNLRNQQVLDAHGTRPPVDLEALLGEVGTP